uniref:Uncharacterized protein n=1 Tax=Rhizophora mucronata TaxID=61149 RepID=A0A2P2NVQ8_RHIMU
MVVVWLMAHQPMVADVPRKLIYWVGLSLNNGPWLSVLQ